MNKVNQLKLFNQFKKYMKLYTTCSSCYKDIKLTQKATTKFEFERKYGEEIELSCRKCDTSNTKHVNRIFAKTEWFWVLLSFGISVFVSLILIFSFGGFGFFVLFAPAAVVFGQQKSISAFNRSKVPRSRK
ncbi:MAG: hypothetical protein KGY51_03260 [Psychroflexus sp.]|nr:hypothetical protein [Psychroflexus sp.]